MKKSVSAVCLAVCLLSVILVSCVHYVPREAGSGAETGTGTTAGAVTATALPVTSAVQTSAAQTTATGEPPVTVTEPENVTTAEPDPFPNEPEEGRTKRY